MGFIYEIKTSNPLRCGRCLRSLEAATRADIAKCLTDLMDWISNNDKGYGAWTRAQEMVERLKREVY